MSKDSFFIILSKRFQILIVIIKWSGGQEIEFHEIEIIILLNWSGDRKGPRGPRGHYFRLFSQT
jgi:hypothetical protein